MANNRRRTLPQVSPKVTAELRPMVAAIKEIIEIGEGVRGDPLDRKITLRDLVDGGIVKIRGGFGPNNPGSLEPSPAPPNLAVPPKPTGFNAIGGFDGRIDLTWDIPGSLYGNHAYTNVYRAEEDNFANSILVGREAGAFYTDIVRDDAAPKPYYYWISFTSTSDIEGPLNSPSGTMAQTVDIDWIIGQLEGRISESELANELLTPIQEIPGIQDTLTNHDSRIDTIQTAVNEVLNLPVFDSALNYDTGDTVKHNGYAWRALRALTAPSPTPVEGADWTQIGAYQTYDDLLSANAVAISDNATEINVLDGQVTAISQDVVALQSDMTTVEGEAGANSLAIGTLESRTTTVEGEISANSSDITLLQNAVNDSNTGLQANADALSLLDSRVVLTEDGLVAVNQDVTNLQSQVDALDVDGNAAALQSLETRVETNETDITAISQDVTTLSSTVGDNTSALQTKAETTVVQNLDGEVTDIKAQFTIKTDVNGYMAGIGLMNDGVTSEFIVASEAVYFIDPGQSITEFDPSTNYSSMTAARNTQLVFGYANIEGQRRFVINVPAYIPEGYIESGMVGAISFGKITDANGSPVTTVSGKLKADYIDVDNLAVASAATFYGDAQSGNFATGSSGWKLWQNGNLEAYNADIRGHIEATTGHISDSVSIGGLGALAYKGSVFYNEVAGTKPPTDADRTATHTSYDTARVAGSSASTIRQYAIDGKNTETRVNSWTRPGQTLIDGNKIFTGDAYVDTLQIKGQAVTVPAASSGTGVINGWNAGGTWGQNVAQFSYNHGENDTLKVVVIATVSGEAKYLTSSINEAPTEWRFRLVVNGSTRYVSPWIFNDGNQQLSGDTYGAGSCSILYDMPAGSNTIYVDAQTNQRQVTNSDMKVTITAIGCKR